MFNGDIITCSKCNKYIREFVPSSSYGSSIYNTRSLDSYHHPPMELSTLSIVFLPRNVQSLRLLPLFSEPPLLEASLLFILTLFDQVLRPYLLTPISFPQFPFRTCLTRSLLPHQPLLFCRLITNRQPLFIGNFLHKIPYIANLVPYYCFGSAHVFPNPGLSLGSGPFLNSMG